MEVYKRETEEIVRRFKTGRLSLPECTAALNAALAGVIPGVARDQIEQLRAIMVSRNIEVMEEMEKRGEQIQSASPHLVV